MAENLQGSNSTPKEKHSLFGKSCSHPSVVDDFCEFRQKFRNSLPLSVRHSYSLSSSKSELKVDLLQDTENRLSAGVCMHVSAKKFDML